MQKLAFLFLLVYSILFFFSNTAVAFRANLDSSLLNAWAEDPEWIALHYYEKKTNGNWKSGIRDDELSKDFFFSKNGFTNPREELQAFYSALTDAREKKINANDDDPRCRFPARFTWLQRKVLELKSIPAFSKIRCERLENWENRIAADGAYILFASAFMNNPASMYGHTFLQLTRSGHTKGESILDYVVAFGADTGNAGGLAYVIGGLSGAFPGTFSTLPYYLKIKEYNDAESRDIWAYKLNISPEQVHFLTQHLWEVRTVHFPYYFLGKNCSYFLLRFLSNAYQGKDLVEQLPAWTIPIDTIRLLEKEQLIGEKIFRPSRSRRVKKRRSYLSKNEKNIVKDFVKESQSALDQQLSKITEQRRVEILDTAYEYLRYFSASAKENTQNKWHDKENTVLSLRSQNPVPEKNLLWDEMISPERGHLSNRIGLGFVTRKTNSWELLDWRPAIHDLLSTPEGFDFYGEQEIFHLKLGFWNQTKMPFVESLRLLHIRALEPFDSWFPRAAWRFHLGWKTLAHTTCTDWHCGFASLDGGIGTSIVFQEMGESIFFAMLGIDMHAGEPFLPHYRIGMGPELGVKLKLLPWWRVLLEAERKFYFLGDRSPQTIMKAQQSILFSPRFSLRTEWIREQKENTFQGAGFYYF